MSQGFILKALKIHKRRRWDKEEGEGKPRIRQVVSRRAVVEKFVKFNVNVPSQKEIEKV